MGSFIKVISRYWHLNLQNVLRCSMVFFVRLLVQLNLTMQLIVAILNQAFTKVLDFNAIFVH